MGDDCTIDGVCTMTSSMVPLSYALPTWLQSGCVRADFMFWTYKLYVESYDILGIELIFRRIRKLANDITSLRSLFIKKNK